MTRDRESFAAHDDAGQDYLIYILRSYANTRTLNEPDELVELSAELRTSAGFAVNYLGKGRYQIVRTGVMLYSDDPNAP